MRHTQFFTSVGVLLTGLWMLCLLPGLSVAAGAHADDADEQVSAEDIVRLNPRAPRLRSSAALVMDEREGVVLYSRNMHEQHPIASVTKLMTAMVILDRHLPMDEVIAIAPEDRDRLRGSASRLRIGVKLTRHDLLLAALAASDNRAAAALARTYPGGRPAMLRSMNEKARILGMRNTHYADPAGLNNGSVSTARDLATLVYAAIQYPMIREFTTTGEFTVTDLRRHRAHRVRQHQSPGAFLGLGHQFEQDRLHRRCGELPGDGDGDRGTPGHHRAAQLLGQAQQIRRFPAHPRLVDQKRAARAAAGGRPDLIAALIRSSAPRAYGIFVRTGVPESLVTPKFIMNPHEPILYVPICPIRKRVAG